MTRSRKPILVTTTETIPEHDLVAVIGLVRGSTVRAKHIGTDIIAGLRNLVGGEMPEYSSLMSGAREQALDRMIAEARLRGADAVVAMRFETSMIAAGASEVMAYGTAVRIEKRT